MKQILLIVAPPPIRSPKGPLAPKFAGGDAKCAGLADAYRETAGALGCDFFDAGGVTPASAVDGIHLDADQHVRLGEAICETVTRYVA
jgi:lysophospholipase L1-like esterase